MKRFSVVWRRVLGDFCMVICYGGRGRGRVVFQRNSLKLARSVHGCIVRLEYTGVIVLSQAEMKQWINSSVMTFKFSSQTAFVPIWLAKVIWQLRLLCLSLWEPTDTAGRGADVLHYTAAIWVFTPLSDAVRRDSSCSHRAIRAISPTWSLDNCYNFTNHIIQAVGLAHNEAVI